MATALPTGDAAEAILTHLRERYDYAQESWRSIRENGTKNMRYVAGDPWEAAERKAREEAGRPCLSLDEISQYTNQVINDLRAKRIGVKFSPAGNGASEDGAALYANKMREIEYRSKAQIVYTTAAQNAIERGYGFARVLTKYLTRAGARFEQDIWLEEFPNPDLVLPDPDAKRPTCSDMRYCFVHETRKIADFKRDFPKARIQDFSSETAVSAPAWIKGDELVLAEYWTIKQGEREVLLLRGPDGTTMEVYADEVPTSALSLVVRRRPVVDPQVCMYLTNGVELLEYSEWPGKYIPIAACVGKVIYLDTGTGTERKILSMVDLMRDPQMLNAYLRTNEAELVGMTPKTPFVGYVGQFRTRGETWQKVNHEPVAYLEADPFTEATGQQVLPLPQRQPYEPPIQALEILAESSRRSIQAAAGSMPLPTAAQRRNEKSGVALREMRETSQVGSFHYSDHYNDMIEHIGVIIEDLIPHIYDTARDVAVRDANETSQMVRINDPADPKSVSTQGEYLVTVSTGPSFESERDAGSDLADTLMGMDDPEMRRAVLPAAIKLKNLGAIGDELVEIAEALQPPQVQALKQTEGHEPSLEQLKAQIAQMTQQLQQAEQVMQALAKDAEGKRLDAETKMKIAAGEAQSNETIAMAEIRSKEEIASREIAARIHIAEISARAKGVQMAHESEHEAVAMAHEAVEDDMDRQHEREMAARHASHQAALAGAQAEAQGSEADLAREHEMIVAAQPANQGEASQ